MNPYTAISLLLSDTPLTATQFHVRSTPYVCEVFPDREPCRIATITVGSLTLQWDQPEHAEAWLRDALAKVEVAKIDLANAQAAPVLPERVTCRAEDPNECICTLVAGHEGPHEAWGLREIVATWPTEPAARIGEPLDLTAGAL